MSGAERDQRFSSTLARGLAVLRAFRPSDDGLGNLEISNRTGIPKPTICRLTHTLCADGYLTQTRRNDKYRLGPAALALGQIAGAAFAFVDAASPVMQSLANRTGALIGIAIHEGDGMLMCKTWTPDDTPRDWMEAGYRMPLLGSSSGRAFLGGVSPAALQKILAMTDPSEVGNMTRAQDEAKSELAKDGFTCIVGEARYSRHINAVAVPYLPRDMSVPVAFLAGAAATDVGVDELRFTVGPALAKAVGTLTQ